MTRHFWVLVHRYAGLYMAFFLIVAGLTGSILAFDDEINAWLDPPEKIAPQAGPRLDELALHERAEALIPQGQVTMLNFNRKPGSVGSVQVAPSPLREKLGLRGIKTSIPSCLNSLHPTSHLNQERAFLQFVMNSYNFFNFLCGFFRLKRLIDMQTIKYRMLIKHNQIICPVKSRI